MKNNSGEMSTGAALLLTIGIILFIGMIISAFEPKCSMGGCDRDVSEGEKYCYLHYLSYKTYGNPDYNAVYAESKKRSESYLSDSGSNTNSSNKVTSGNASTKKNSNYNSYDEGYEDVYENEDYDWDRYWSDSDYADGVDDAMEDADW